MKIISIALFFVTGLMAQMIPQHLTTIVFKEMPITVAPGDYELVNQVVDVPPGGVIPNHYNGGPAVVSILAGRLTIKDASGPLVLAAGQSTTERGGHRHMAMNTGTSVARLSISYLVPKGAPLNTFEK